jgi:hypothetical protein
VSARDAESSSGLDALVFGALRRARGFGVAGSAFGFATRFGASSASTSVTTRRRTGFGGGAASPPAVASLAAGGALRRRGGFGCSLSSIPFSLAANAARETSAMLGFAHNHHTVARSSRCTDVSPVAI